MILFQDPKKRVLLARWGLFLLVLGLLLSGPRILPCPHCDWEGHMRLSGMPSHITCNKCCGDGFLTCMNAGILLAGGKPSIEPHFVTVTTFGELPLGWPTFREELWSKLVESKGNIRIYWPSPPTM